MASAQPLVDHDRIREWAEARGAKPARVKGTGGRRGQGDVGMIRLDFPGYSGARSLQPISWKEWFRQFDENNLALLVGSGPGTRRFNKLVSRSDTRAAAADRGMTGRASAGTRSEAGAMADAPPTGARRRTARRSTRTRKTAGTRSTASTRRTAGTRKTGAARNRRTTRKTAGARTGATKAASRGASMRKSASTRASTRSASARAGRKK
ncbi:MAG TPA: hypothetical protein VIL25_10040 [Vicinamibacterales bacterium]